MSHTEIQPGHEHGHGHHAHHGHNHEHDHAHAHKHEWDGEEYLKMPGVKETAVVSHESVIHALKQAGLSDADIASRHLLEIGCGGGAVTRHYAGTFASVHAIDTSPSMLLALSQRLPVNTTYSLHFMTPESPGQFRSKEPFFSPTRGDNERKLAPPRAQFDVIVANLVVHHVDDLDSFMKGVTGLLAPGGWVIFTEFGKEGEDSRDHAAEKRQEWHDEIAHGKKDEAGSVNRPGHFHPAFTLDTARQFLEKGGLVDVHAEIRGRLPVWEEEDKWPLCLIVRGRKA